MDKCVGCKKCIDKCLYGAIEIINNKAHINEMCIDCGICISSCEFDALYFPNKDIGLTDNLEYKDIMVFCEQRNGKLMQVASELLTEGKRLADKTECDVNALIIGNDVLPLCDKIMSYGAKKIIIAENELLREYSTDAFTKVFCEAIEKYKPSIVLIGATSIGRDLAPRIAARIHTGLTADCISFEIDFEQGILLQTRPAFGGNLMATIVTKHHRPQIATVRPGVMEVKFCGDVNHEADVETLNVEIAEEDIRTLVLDVVEVIKDKAALGQAEIIVSGGRGLGNATGFSLIEKLANSLGGVVGATRAAVDAGWIDHSFQVGQTGETVRPKLYIACGISGAVQHVVGMQKSDYIVAINKDPNAAIFNVADCGISGDLYEIIPLIIEQLENAEKLHCQ